MADEEATTWEDPENDDAVVQAIERAVKAYRLCPNRVWAIARSLPQKEKSLPFLFPPQDDKVGRMFASENCHESGRRGTHDRCTFDFCEISQMNFTAVPQRHEVSLCRGPQCKPIQKLFNPTVLDKPAQAGVPTAWYLRGKVIAGPDQKFMAISHVWSDGTGAGSWPQGEVNTCLYHFFRNIARSLNCGGIWWDTLCIPRDKHARVKAINHMHRNYEAAEVTLIHDTFLRDTEWVDAETACLAVLMSPWFSRAWTALELAKSRTVKVMFKGKHGEILKDLDNDILLHPQSDRHRLAANVIKRLRSNAIDNINDLLAILGSRYTSWARDMAVIAGLLVGIDDALIPENGSSDDLYQQDIYRKVLFKLRGIGYGHLFHNLPTISDGTGWCPTSLLNLPPDSSDNLLSIDSNGDVVGKWRLVRPGSIPRNAYVWKDVHPLIAARLRPAISRVKNHLILVEQTRTYIDRAIVVMELGADPLSKSCQFIGSLHIYPPQKLRQDQYRVENVRIVYQNISEQAHGRINTVMEQKAQTPAQIKRPLHHSDSARTSAYNQGPVANVLASTLWPTIGINNIEPSASLREPIESGRLSSELLRAAKEGKEEHVRWLLREGADLKCKDQDGRTSLSWAAGEGHHAIVEFLILWIEALVLLLGKSYGYRSDFSGGYNYSVFSEVSQHLNSTDDSGSTSLLWAVRGGRSTIVELMLQWYEFDIDAQDNLGNTPLLLASMLNHTTIVKALLTGGAAQVVSGKTALCVAAEYGSLETMQVLMDHGSDINQAGREHGTPLAVASYYGKYDAARLLLIKGAADFPAPTGSGENALHLACSHGDDRLVELLLEFGADVNFCVKLFDGHFCTPLVAASKHGHHSTVELLLRHGATIDMRSTLDRNEYNWFEAGLFLDNALCEASGHGHFEIADLLMKRGADVNRQMYDHSVSQYQNALLRAASGGFIDIIQLLLSKGAEDVDDLALRAVDQISIDKGIDLDDDEMMKTGLKQIITLLQEAHNGRSERELEHMLNRFENTNSILNLAHAVELDEGPNLTFRFTTADGRSKLCSISLDDVLMNDNGTFIWQPYRACSNRGNLKYSAKNLKLIADGKVLQADLLLNAYRDKRYRRAIIALERIIYDEKEERLELDERGLAGRNWNGLEWAGHRCGDG